MNLTGKPEYLRKLLQLGEMTAKEVRHYTGWKEDEVEQAIQAALACGAIAWKHGINNSESCRVYLVKEHHELPSVPSARVESPVRPIPRSMCSMRCEALGVCQAFAPCAKRLIGGDSAPQRRTRSSRDIGLSERDAT